MIVVAVLLALVVLALWLAVWGFARLPNAYDRLHCTSFAAIAVGAPLVVLAFVADGASDRAFKILLLVVLMLISGAATTHASARAIAARDAGREGA